MAAMEPATPATASAARKITLAADACAAQPGSPCRESELSRRHAVATELRGALNALTLSLHVLERHGSDAQALEFTGYVASAARRIAALTKQLYEPPAHRVRPARNADAG